MSGEGYSTRNVSIWNQKYQKYRRLRFHQKASTLQCQCPSRYHQILANKNTCHVFLGGFLKVSKLRIMTWCFLLFVGFYWKVIWMFPKIVGFAPKSSHVNSGFSIIFIYKPSILWVLPPLFFWKHLNLICLDEWVKGTSTSMTWWPHDPFLSGCGGGSWTSKNQPTSPTPGRWWRGKGGKGPRRMDKIKSGWNILLMEEILHQLIW